MAQLEGKKTPLKTRNGAWQELRMSSKVHGVSGVHCIQVTQTVQIEKINI